GVPRWFSTRNHVFRCKIEGKGKFKSGRKYSIQPALNYPGRGLDALGYSFRWIGGNATAVIVPREVLEMNCLLPYEGEGFFKASLSEPVSCVIGAFNAQYHFKAGEHVHKNGIVEGGAMAVLAGAGPMGLEAIDYAAHGPRKPRLLVVTDIDRGRLDRAARIFTVADAAKHKVGLRYVNTSGADPVETLKALTDGKGYDDVFVFAPVPALIEQASRLLAFNGCLNFFAGPPKHDFFAAVNFYEIHYSGHHVVGSSGGNADDMREGLELIAKNRMNPAAMVTHVGGLDCAAKTIIDLPTIPGAKKLIYTGVSLPLVALEDFGKLGRADPFFKELARITEKHDGIWSVEAESYLLANAKPIKVNPERRAQ
ncbi:MAG: zinc-binding dehydrogenase, partial [Verrucomicrobiota bacterium]|nr:zinc-binding dehydrogenase [Verrucomicrobiota bacterium]